VKLTIASVEAIALAAPFERVYGGLDHVPDWLLTPASSHRVLPRLGQYSTLVRIRTTDGLEGIGEAYGLPEPRVTATIVGSLLGPVLIGRDGFATEAIWELMYGLQSAAGRTAGFYLEALSGIDLALWDLRGKATGLPVHRLLGGPVRDAVPVYASPVPFLPTPAGSVERALSLVDDGFHAIKLKLGRGEATDLAHASAVASALSGRVGLNVDLNCAYDVKTAIRLGRALEPLGVRWLEEPLATDDVAGLAEVRAGIAIPVVTGENEFTRYGFRDLLTARAVDIVMPNLARSGGITEARRVAALCSAFHVEVSPHGVGGAVALAAAVQFAAATPNVTSYEYNRLPNPLRDDLVVTKPSLVDGALQVPDSPGLGVELDWDLVGSYEVFRA
jgi:L-alanine-DL-glutamate epimerase-like enolase superfamily enzyme